MKTPSFFARHPVGAIALGLFLLVAVFYGPGVVRGEIPWFMDTIGQFYPARSHAAHLLHSGQLPLWNRTVYGGTALLANPQWGLLYPGHWPFLARPGGAMYSLTNAAHILLMALGMLLWLNRLLGRVGLPGAAMAAGLSILGGWTWSHLAFGSYLQVATWFPWMLWAWTVHALSCRNTRPLFWGAVAGCFGAMQWLSGAPQLALYCLAGVWFFSLIHGVLVFRKQAFGALLTFLVPMSIVTLGLSAPQWLMSRALLEECGRSGGLPLERVLGGALDYKGLLRAWIGGTGRPENAEQILYPGLVTIFLALLGLVGLPFRKTEKKGRLLWPVRLTLGTLLVVATLSCYQPAARFLYKWLPLYDHFHDPMRVLFLGFIATLALSAIGFNELWRVMRNVGQPQAQLLFDAGLTALALAALVDVTVFADRNIDTKSAKAAYLENPDMHFLVSKILDTDVPRCMAVDHGMQYTYNYTRSDFNRSLLPGLSPLHDLTDVQGYDPAIPWRYGFYVRRANALPAPSPTLYASHFGIFRNLDSPWLWRFGPMAFVGPARHRWPLVNPRWLGPQQALRIDLKKSGQPWTPTPENIKQIHVYLGYAVDTEQPEAAADTMDVVFRSNDREILAQVRVKASETDPRETPGLDWLWPDVLDPHQWNDLPASVRVIPVHGGRITSSTLSNPEKRPAASIEIRNPSRSPGLMFYSIGLPEADLPVRATLLDFLYTSTYESGFPTTVQMVVSPATLPSGVVPDSRQRKNYLQIAARYRPDVTHIELDSPEAIGSKSTHLIKDYQIAEIEANRVVVDMEGADQAGWLVLAEPWQRGWRCRIDGKEAPIYPADTLFRAVFVEAGAREVVFTYWPPGLNRGMLVALASLALALLAVVYRPGKSPEHQNTSIHASD